MDGTPTDSERGSLAERAVPYGDGRTVSYAEYGSEGGEPVVFLHGTPGSRRLGRLFDGAARRNGVRLVAIDRPGCGRSSPWPDRTLTDTGAFVAPVLDDAGVSRAGVVAFSGGGPHALALAATRGDLVTEIDVVSGATPPGQATPATQRLLGTLATTAPAVLKGLFRGQAWLAEHVSPSVVASQYTAADVPDDVVDLVGRDFVEAFARHRSGAATELGLLARPWNVPLEEIDHRIRLWHGGRDSNVPVAGARHLRDRLPDGELTVFEDTDHLTTLLRSRSAVLEHY